MLFDFEIYSHSLPKNLKLPIDLKNIYFADTEVSLIIHKTFLSFLNYTLFIMKINSMPCHVLFNVNVYLISLFSSNPLIKYFEQPLDKRKEYHQNYDGIDAGGRSDIPEELQSNYTT